LEIQAGGEPFTFLHRQIRGVKGSKEKTCEKGGNIDRYGFKRDRIPHKAGPKRTFFGRKGGFRRKGEKGKKQVKRESEFGRTLRTTPLRHVRRKEGSILGDLDHQKDGRNVTKMSRKKKNSAIKEGGKGVGDGATSHWLQKVKKEGEVNPEGRTDHKTD